MAKIISQKRNVKFEPWEAWVVEGFFNTYCTFTYSTGDSREEVVLKAKERYLYGTEEENTREEIKIKDRK